MSDELFARLLDVLGDVGAARLTDVRRRDVAQLLDELMTALRDGDRTGAYELGDELADLLPVRVLPVGDRPVAGHEPSEPAGDGVWTDRFRVAAVDDLAGRLDVLVAWIERRNQENS